MSEKLATLENQPPGIYLCEHVQNGFTVYMEWDGEWLTDANETQSDPGDYTNFVRHDASSATDLDASRSRVAELESQLENVVEELTEIYSALRNFKKNGSNAANQIRGIYNDFDLASCLLSASKQRVAELEGMLSKFGSLDEACSEKALHILHSEERREALEAIYAEARRLAQENQPMTDHQTDLRQLRELANSFSLIEPGICAKCGDEYRLRDGQEPTLLCDTCAHEIVSKMSWLLDAAERRMDKNAIELKQELGAWEFMARQVHIECDDAGVPKPPENEPGIPWRMLWLIRKLASVEAELDSLRAALAERDARDREIFDAGFKVAVGYGDNFIHYRGEQADRVFAKSMEALSQASAGGV